MNIKLTNEQIENIIDKEIYKCVKNKVDEVLNSSYWSNLNTRINNAVEERVKELVTHGKCDRAVRNVDKQAIIRSVGKDLANEMIQLMDK